MKKTQIKTILEATGGRLFAGNEDAYISGVKHDSREVTAGDMFVAIVGENQNGHKYIRQTIEAGAGAVLASETDGWFEDAKALIEENGVSVILVEDTVTAMGDFAKAYLKSLNIKKVAVTGSVGKTSVRDMIYYVLSEKYNCGRNLKNFNNFIGLPISIFALDENVEVAVLEMGMNHFDEIDRLAEIVEPDIGVITNVGVAHIENLGSREGIFKAKMEIAAHIKPKSEGGYLVFQNDDCYLTSSRTAGDYGQIAVGTCSKCDYIVSDIDDKGLAGINFLLSHDGKKEKINLPIPGVHNTKNAALAIAIAHLLGLTTKEAQKGLSKVSLTGSRLKIVRNGNISIIDDTYNANPDSMKAALEVLHRSECKGKKIAILGDMFELGENSGNLHLGVGVFAKNLSIDTLIAIGEDAAQIAKGATGRELKAVHFADKDAFISVIDEYIGLDDVILVKGSRGMKMEVIVEKLAEI